ncbi:MAG TPA: polysaccharide biosynthesis tyrosine autokinase [Opitutaceae bacterium]|nr:polysaccharide biosynthesis tyrosine autokinase [Opitutaceae bacterium]
MASIHGSREGATLADFFQLLRLRKALIFLILGLVVITTAVVTALLPKWYASTLNIRVEKPEGQMSLLKDQPSSYYDPYYLQDQFKIMQSEKILYPVIDRLQLGERLAASLGSQSAVPKDVIYDYLTQKMLHVESPRGSSLIEVGVYARDPELAAKIANEIGNVYSQDRIDFATSQQREGLTQLRKELEKQEGVVSAQRDLVEKLRKDLNISGVDMNARYSDMEIETLRQMQNSLIALSVDAIGRKTRYERFKSIPVEERENLINSELIPDPNIQNLLQAYLIADQTVTKLRGRLGEAHPELIAAVENRAKIKEQLDAQLRGFESALEISYKEAEARVAELKNQLAQAKVDQILSARERMRPFEEAVQKLDDDTRVLSTTKLQLRQREIDFQVPKRTIEILNHAEPARRPSRPNWAVNLIFATLFGTVLGVGTAVLVEYFDTSFRNVAEVESRLQRPVLGVIPNVAEPLKKKGEEEDPAELEPLRVLHTNLNLALKGEPRGRSLIMLSAGPGEGKSTTLLRLARAIAAAGEKVLLIDSDLRRPTQHALMGTRKDPGLADVLQGKATADAAIQRDVQPNLDFLPCGNVGSFALTLLFVERLRDLLESVRGRYDRIIFDAPPIIGVSDASVMASVADDVMLLIQHRRNPQSMVLRAQQILESLGKPVIGVVLNRVPSNSSEDYGYYTRNYAYYSNRSEKPRRSRRSKTAPDSAGETEETSVTPERIRFSEREKK